MEDLQARHRKEQRELQGRITSKKKNATKKTRKGVNDECERLERVLKEKQQAEIAALASPSSHDDDTASTRSHDAGQSEPTSIETHAAPEFCAADSVALQERPNSQQENVGKKPNRQKARLARRAADQEAQRQAADDEAASMPDRRQQELAAMKKQMEHHELVEVFIQPDGHCLYSACARVIPASEGLTHQNVRIAAADYMTAHPDEFFPFLEEPLDSYTRKIRNTAEWGGHLELQAIARAYNININVLQASGHIENIRPEQPGEEIAWLAYYRHSFGLGEHYNALTRSGPA